MSNELGNDKGVILPLSLMVIVGLFLLGADLLVSSRSAYRTAGAERDLKRALYVAEAGIERAIYVLNQDDDWSDNEITDLFNGDKTISYSLGEVSYTGTYTVALTTASKENIQITSTSEVNKSKRKIKVKVTR